MAITKILARKGRLDVGINYILNGDKTEDKILTAHFNCDPGQEYRQMMDTKQIIVYAPEKVNGKRTQKVKIVFNFLEEVEVPEISEPIITETTYGRRKTA